MKLLTLAFLVAALPTFAAAHPHHAVDQQVSLALMSEGVAEVIQIVPSDLEGPAIFAALDADSDGSLSEAEMEAFAARVVAETSLTVGGVADALTVTSVSRPERAEVEAGLALIAVEAQGQRPLEPGASVEVRFAIAFDEFAPGWFVQPFVAPSVLPDGQAPVIERSEDNAAVTVRMADA